MQFEQIKAITEKYGSVMEQLDRLREGYKFGTGDYWLCLEKMKLAVADQFTKEASELMGQTPPQVSPTAEVNGAV